MRRRLYYGDKASLDSPSLPLTELTVEYFKESVSQQLGHVDLDVASNLVKRSRVSPCSMVMSMLYAKRLRQCNTDYLGSMSSSDVFFISMMMASKYLYDEGVDEEVFNDEWANNSEQDVDDVNQMEIGFLQAMDWHLFARPDEFEDTLADIERSLALREGIRRGWFTYSELAVLADSNFMSCLWTNVGLECTKLTSVLSVAYVTSLLSLLGSTALAVQLSGPLSSTMVAIISTQLAPLAASNWQAIPPCDPTTLNSVIWPEGNFKDTSDYDQAFENETQSGQVNGVFCGGLVDLPGVPSGVGGQFFVSDYPSDVVGCQYDTSDDISGLSPQQKVKSSLLSIWFFDSFLSQLWSATSDKVKPPSCCDQIQPSQRLDGEELVSPQCKVCLQKRRRICSHRLTSSRSGLPSAVSNSFHHHMDVHPKIFAEPSKNCPERCLHPEPHDDVVIQLTSRSDFTCSILTPDPESRKGCHFRKSDHCNCDLENAKFPLPPPHSSGDLSILPPPWKTSDSGEQIQMSLMADAYLLRVPLGFHTGLPHALEVT